MAEIWDETKPAGSRSPLLGDDDIRECKRAVRERLAFDHQFQASESPAFGDTGSIIGTHNAVRLNEQGSDPATVANQAAIFAKVASAVSELFMRGESNGTVKQLTQGGCQKLNTMPFNNGTVDIAFPTNNLSAGTPKFMLGDSSTIIWMYLNAAPPGWKVLATGADTILGVSGGAVAYNVNGGSAGGTWTQPGHTHSGPLHTHYMDHTHVVNGTISGGTPSYGSPVFGGDAGSGMTHTHPISLGTQNASAAYVSYAGDAATGSGATAATWRPAASIGKLFQLDTP